MFHRSIRCELQRVAFTTDALLLITLLSVSLTARADVTIPDTPAGHTLQAFLNAFKQQRDPDRQRHMGYQFEWRLRGL
jgi:hypothetical protein